MYIIDDFGANFNKFIIFALSPLHSI